MRKVTVVLGVLLLLSFLTLSGCAVVGRATPTPSPTPVPPTATPAPTPTPTPTPYLSLFVEPDDGIDPVLQGLESAKKSIRMVMYLITEPKIIQALKDAVARGVDVRVMLEMNPYGGSSNNVDVGLDLKKAGVTIRWDPHTINYLHEKAIVIDDEVAYIMTLNMTSSSFSANREYGIIDKNPDDIAEIVKVFEADWNREAPDLANPRLIWSPINARERTIELLDSAQNTLDIEEQEMLDEELEEHIIQAVKRGVKVRYISSAHYPLSNDLNEIGREKLRQAGVDVRYVLDPYIHAKMFVIDGKTAFVGSENFSTNSLDFNRELGITFDDPALVARLSKVFETDWNKGTKEAFPTSGLATPECGYISHKDAKKFLYQKVKVEMPVRETYNSGRVIWLMPDADQDTNFKVVIFPSVWGKWPQVPDVFYKGKTIRVYGLIKTYRGWPEVIVNDPSQIEVVK